MVLRVCFLGVAPLCVAAPFRARLFASVLRTAAFGGTLQAANARRPAAAVSCLNLDLCDFLIHVKGKLGLCHLKIQISQGKHGSNKNVEAYLRSRPE